MPIYFGDRRVLDVFIGTQRLREWRVGTRLVYRRLDHFSTRRVFTQNGTYNPPDRTRWLEVITVGGGASAQASNQPRAGNAGDASAIIIPAQTLQVTVGEGGPRSRTDVTPWLNNPGTGSGVVGDISRHGSLGGFGTNNQVDGEDSPTINFNGNSYTWGRGGVRPSSNGSGTNGGVGAGGSILRVGLFGGSDLTGGGGGRGEVIIIAHSRPPVSRSPINPPSNVQTVTTSGNVNIEPWVSRVDVVCLGGGEGGGDAVGDAGRWAGATITNPQSRFSVTVGAGGSRGNSGNNSTALGVTGPGGGRSGGAGGDTFTFNGHTYTNENPMGQRYGSGGAAGSSGNAGIVFLRKYV